MPREEISTDDDTRIQVGWGAGGIQIGVGLDRPLIEAWMERHSGEIGAFLRNLDHDTVRGSIPIAAGVDESGVYHESPPSEEAINEAYGRHLIQFLAGPSISPYHDQWARLNDRQSVQALLRLLKKARNRVWGADE